VYHKRINHYKKTKIFKQKRIDGLERKEPMNKYRSYHVLVIRRRATLQSTKQAEYGSCKSVLARKETKDKLQEKAKGKLKTPTVKIWN